MIGYRDGKWVFYCDGCHGVIQGKKPRKGKHKGTHFHNRRCEHEYKPTPRAAALK